MEIAVLALGCFWGAEKKYGQLDGIYRTEVGYCGGNSPNTNYRAVSYTHLTLPTNREV